MTFVVKTGEDGRPRVERTARWRLVGASDPDPSADRDDWMLTLRDQGLGPDPVVTYADGSDGREVILVWPDLGGHAVDPEHARLVALASVPLNREIPELTGTEPDPEHEAEVERQAAEDRQQWEFVERLTKACGRAFLRRRAAARRVKRTKPPQSKDKPSPSPTTFYEGQGGPDGWHWTRSRPQRPRARARWKR
jgi:hypothetical protein